MYQATAPPPNSNPVLTLSRHAPVRGPAPPVLDEEPDVCTNRRALDRARGASERNIFRRFYFCVVVRLELYKGCGEVKKEETKETKKESQR